MSILVYPPIDCNLRNTLYIHNLLTIMSNLFSPYGESSGASAQRSHEFQDKLVSTNCSISLMIIVVCPFSYIVKFSIINQLYLFIIIFV